MIAAGNICFPMALCPAPCPGGAGELIRLAPQAPDDRLDERAMGAIN